MTITVYSLCATEFFIRYFKKRPVRLDTIDATRGTFDPYLKYMSLALAFNTTCLFIRYVRICYYDSSDHLQSNAFIRAVYRTIELSDGWTGRIIGTQVYFSASFFPLPLTCINVGYLDVLDGAMIVLAIYTLNFAHPGVLLARKPLLKSSSNA